MNTNATAQMVTTTQVGCGKAKPTTGEWTVEPVKRSDGSTWPGIAYISQRNGSTFGSFNEQQSIHLVAAINAALADVCKVSQDSQRALWEATKQLANKERDYKIACTMRDNHSKQLEAVLPIRIQLEDALTSIEKESDDQYARSIANIALAKVKDLSGVSKRGEQTPDAPTQKI